MTFSYIAAGVVVLYLILVSRQRSMPTRWRTAFQCCAMLIGIDLMWILLRTIQTLPR